MDMSSESRERAGSMVAGIRGSALVHNGGKVNGGESGDSNRYKRSWIVLRRTWNARRRLEPMKYPLIPLCLPVR